MSRQPDELMCSTVLDRIEAFVDEELAPDEAAAITQHLARCASCSREVNLAESVAVELRSLPSLQAPEVLSRNVRAATAGAWARRMVDFLSVVHARPMMSAGVSLVVLAVLVGGALWRHEMRPSPTDEAVARATAEARLAFAYVGVASRKAAGDLRKELFRDRVVAPTMRGLSLSLQRAVPLVSADEPVPGTRTTETRS
jgi:anti-sigma factor (TIGR02949 family)